jgi:hypothetical protein
MNRPVDSLTPRDPRRGVVLPARARGSDFRAEVCVRNISSRGMMISAEVPPARGSYVEIIVGSHSIVGRVMWVGDDCFGIRTRDKLDPDLVGSRDRLPGRDLMKAPAQMLSLDALQAKALHSSRIFSAASGAATAVVAAVCIGSAVFAGLSHVTEMITAHLPN